MKRGCLIGAAFGVSAFLGFILWTGSWLILFEPGPPSDNGGRAIGLATWLLITSPLVTLLTGAVGALIVWKRIRTEQQ